MPRLARLLLPALLSPALLATAAAPVSALPPAGACVAASDIARPRCVPGEVHCSPGSAITVEVIGFGRGYATCGGAVAGCRTLELSYCQGSDTATSFGTLECRSDPFEPSPAVVVCYA